MMASFHCLVFAALVLVVAARPNDSPDIPNTGSSGEASAKSSVSINTPGTGVGSWNAGTYTGAYPGAYPGAFPGAFPRIGSGHVAGAGYATYAFPSVNYLQNIYTYAGYLQQYITQIQSLVHKQLEAQRQAALASASSVAHGVKPQKPYPTPAFSSGGGGIHGAIAGGYVGPNGGYGSAGFLPSPTTVQGGSVPGSSGPGYHGVFSSSSSSSSDINGHHKEQHASTFGVDNNGKVTIYHAQNP